MRILVECISIRTGGGIQVALDVLSRVAFDADVEAAVICSKEIALQLDPRLASRFATFVVTPVGTPIAFGRARLAAHKLESEFHPQVVYTIFGPSYWRPHAAQVTGFAYGSLLFGRVAKPKLSAASSGFVDYSSWKDVIRRHFLRRADLLLVETEVVRNRLSSYLGVPSTRIQVVGNTVGSDFCSYEFRPRSGSTLQVLVPAPYYEHKNLEIVPHVAKFLQDVHGIHDFGFLLTIPETSPEWTRIAQCAQTLGVSERVRTAGAVPYADMPQQYSDASCVFLPTLMECFTAVYPESFKAGRPVVTSRREFAKELCGDAAAYCDPLEAQDCAREVARVLKDSTHAEGLVARGRLRLSTHFVSAPERYSRIKTALQLAASI